MWYLQKKNSEFDLTRFGFGNAENEEVLNKSIWLAEPVGYFPLFVAFPGTGRLLRLKR